MTPKKILFLTPYPENKAPSQRLKFEQYYSIFNESGYEITTSCFISNKFWNILYLPNFLVKKFLFIISGYIKRFFIILTIRKYDIVYVHLWVSPIGLPFFEWIVSILSKKLIYDIDDMVFLGHSSEANKFWQRIKGNRKMIYLMKKANHVITCTPKLDDFVRQFNQNTTDISSTVDTEKRYLPVNNYKNDHQIVLGWSGSHSTSKYLYLLQDVLKDLAKHYDYKLLVMGDASFRIEGINIEAIEWKESIEINTLQKFDIGLYPLPDEEWVYGKSGLKAIQYMALGIPTIATAIATNYRIIKEGVNGFLINPNDIDSWKIKIEELMINPEIRKKIGDQARETIIKYYSIDVNKEKYLTIFRKFDSIDL